MSLLSIWCVTISQRFAKSDVRLSLIKGISSETSLSGKLAKKCTKNRDFHKNLDSHAVDVTGFALRLVGRANDFCADSFSHRQIRSNQRAPTHSRFKKKFKSPVVYLNE